MIESRKPGTGACVLDMAYSMNGPVVRYSWRINTMLGANSSTITGQRLSSGQWRQSGEDNRKAKYILNHNIGS